jgi:hypothetical protein
MANEFFGNIPDWLKSLWHMENELRRAARNGVILRREAARAHLAAARRHLDQAINDYRTLARAKNSDVPARKDAADAHGSIPDDSPGRPNKKQTG